MSVVSYIDGSWRGPSDRTFSYRCWRPDATRALLVLIHGFGEHSGRYDAFAGALAAQGLYVAAPDLWGHGRSDGSRGDIHTVAGCVDDLQRLTEAVFLPVSRQSRYALFGHSVGGLIAIHWALKSPQALSRLVAQSPLLETGFPIPRWKRAAVALLGAWWPTVSFSMDVDVGALSHDPAVAQAYRTDPLVHNAMSARTYRSLLRARDEALERAATIRIPTLLLTGDADRIISVAAAQRWFDRLQCQKQRVDFPGAYHELHHEPVRDEVRRLVCAWVLDES